MILWSSRKLEKAVAEGQLSEWEKVKYILFLAIFEVLLGGPIFLVKPHYGSPIDKQPFVTLVGCVVMAWVTFYGIRLAYRRNQKIDDKEFIERFAILSVPVSIKFIVGFVPGTFVAFLIIDIVSCGRMELGPYIGPIFQMGFPFVIFWFYWLVAKSIGRFGELKCNRDP